MSLLTLAAAYRGSSSSARIHVSSVLFAPYSFKSVLIVIAVFSTDIRSVVLWWSIYPDWRCAMRRKAHASSLLLCLAATLVASSVYGEDPAIVGADYFRATATTYNGPGGAQLSYAAGIVKIKTNISTSGATAPPTISFGVVIGNVPNEFGFVPTNLPAVPDPADPGHYCFIYFVAFNTSTQGAAAVRWTHAGTTTSQVWAGPINF